MADTNNDRNLNAGELDKTYGQAGVCRLEFSDGLVTAFAAGKNGYRGSIYAGGTGQPTSNGRSFFLARILGSGQIDTGFARGGIVGRYEINRSASIVSVAVQEDGKIIIMGKSGDLYPALARFNMDGTFDSSFGVGGVVIIRTSGVNEGEAQRHKEQQELRLASDSHSSIVLLPDGKILIAISIYTDHQLIRLESNGELDKGFQSEGFVNVTVPPPYTIMRITGLAIQELEGSRKLMVSGFCSRLEAGGGDYPERFHKSFFARFHFNGERDVSFKDQGVLIVEEGDEEAELWGAAIQSNGSILGVGRTPVPSWGDSRPPTKAVLFRIMGDGERDMYCYASRTGQLEWYSVDTQADEKIVTVGNWFADSRIQGLVGRYHQDGSPDVEFGNEGDGIVTLPNFDFGWPLAVENNGLILVGGTVIHNGVSVPAVLRVLT